jgi:hypothetical protein
MSTDPFDSTYDLVVPPRQNLPVQPPPQVISYRSIAPAEPIKPAEKIEEPPRKLTLSEWLFYWFRMLGAFCVILAGAAWLIVMHHFHEDGLSAMFIGFVIIGIGFALLLFSGPSDSEKRGYHF